MITYGEYKKLGYTAVPKKQFARFADMAGKAVLKFTNRKFFHGRININEKNNDINEDVKRGFCEICDLYYAEYQAVNQTNGAKIAGFSNDGYREQYFENENMNIRVFELMQLYFPREQLFRGV
jgi:hypothetical protein